MSNRTTRELRIAPVMTGGTSLAIWMGGATAELYRLLRSERDDEDAAVENDVALRIYRGLLDLTETKPVVDVITGTSAGGLNGTLLAAALRCGVTAEDFMAARTTWMDVADIEQLMRSTHDPNPPSVLRGDDFFVPELRKILEGWRDRYTLGAPGATPAEAEEAEGADVDLVTTLTTVTGVPNPRADDFSESISQLDHAQTLRFRGDQFNQDDWPHRLAIAARTSASIPGVFEPSFIPIGEEDAEASHRPDFRPNASFGQSRWAVDGGVVVNLPLTEAIDRIFARTASTEVRRVVLYVSPTPGVPEELGPEDPDEPPDLRTTLLTAITAVRAEGVAADIDLIARTNRQVKRQEQTRRYLRPLFDSIDEDENFDTYRTNRARSSVEQMLAGVRAATAEDLPEDDERLITSFLAEREALLPTELALPAEGAGWPWGIAAVEQATSIVLGLMARLESYVEVDTREAQALEESRELAHKARRRAGRIRGIDDRYWQDRLGDLPDLSDKESASDNLMTWAQDSYGGWPGETRSRDTILGNLAEAHRWAATALDESTAALRATADALTADDEEADPLAAADAQAVLDELNTLVAGAPIDDDARVAHIETQLLRTHVAQTLLLGDVRSREQRVELMQVSWNAWNGLDERRAPKDKLAGPELGRLGAFVKPSWRANDWCWGRMDGAHRLVVLLLDPARLRALHRGRPPEAFLAEMTRKIQDLAGTGDDLLPPAVLAELNALKDPTEPLQAMPETAKLIALRLQTEIARDELPNVANAVDDSKQLGGNEVRSRAFADAVLGSTDLDGKLPPDEVPDADVAKLVKKMQIGSEGVRSEFGFGLLNRVASRMSALTVNAVTGKRSGIPVAPRLLRPLRTPLHGVNSVVSVITGGSQLARAAGAVILALAGAFVGLRLLGVDTPPGAFVISAILLTGLFFGAMFRSGFIWLGLCFVAGAVLIGLTLAGSDVQTVLYSSNEAVSTTPLDPNAIISVPDGANLQIVVDGPVEGERIYEDRTIKGDDADIVLSDEGFALETPSTNEVVAWKRYGFINAWSLFRILTCVAAVIILVSLARRWRGASTAKRVGIVGIGVITGLTAWVLVSKSREFFEELLTGAVPSEDSGLALSSIDGWKDRVTDSAVELNDVRIEVVLGLLVLASVVLAFGSDLATSRYVRKRTAAIKDWFGGGS